MCKLVCSTLQWEDAHPVLFSDFVPLVNLFGVYFQIRDDYMNLQSTEVSAVRLTLLGVPAADHRRSTRRIKGSQKTSLRANSLSPLSTASGQTHRTDKF